MIANSFIKTPRVVSLLLCLLVVGVLSALDSVSLDIHLTDTAQVQISSTSTINYTYPEQRTRILLHFDRNALNLKVVNGVININDTPYFENMTLFSTDPLKLGDNEYSGTLILSVVPQNQIRIINHIDLEDYIAGVISAEIGGSAPLEALKSQAVATRTITITKVMSGRHRADGYDLCSAVHCQVYKGLTGQTPQSLRAATETINQILLYDGKPIEAFYSSHCGGIAEDSGELWSVSHPYLTKATDEYCINEELIPNWNKRFINWEREFTYAELTKLADFAEIINIWIYETSPSGRVKSLAMRMRQPDRPQNGMSRPVYHDMLVWGNSELRHTLNLPSTLFTVETEGDKVIFKGNGYGHGVGMCQTGAIARANSGQGYIEILSHYFPNTQLDDTWLLSNAILEK